MTERKKLLTLGGGIALIALFLVIRDTPDGGEIFRREGCISCHSFKGQGAGAGPELTGVTSRRSDSWIRDQIKDPRLHDPDSRMPAFGHLSRREIRALIAYLKS